jgi:uncharacterized membrane protein YjgN (DUF898 family)
LPLRFRGQAREYVRLWVVNVALTLASLGLYGPWARVRLLRYLHGHTQIGAHSFDYEARPGKILFARLLMLLLLALLNLGPVILQGWARSSGVAAGIQALLSLLVLLWAPWLAVQALRFRARCTSFRHVRFHFGVGGRHLWREAVLLALLRLVAVPLSLGLLHPYSAWRSRRFLIGQRHYGTTPFVFTARPGQYLRLHLRGLALLALVGAALLLTGATGSAVVGRVRQGERPPLVLGLGMGLGLILTLVCTLLWLTYLEAGAAWLTWHHTTLGPLWIRCGWRWRELLVLRLTNTLAVLFSLGLLIPWARMRGLRYRLEGMAVGPAEALDGFMAREGDAAGAFGDEALSLLGLISPEL